MSLSVIIPSHNTRQLTLACLESLAPVGVEEVLVVDNGSQDETCEAIGQRFGEDSWPQLTVWSSPEPLGFTGAVNQGLAKVSGELILLLNSDAEWEQGDDVPSSEGLRALHSCFESDPSIGIVGARLLNPDGSPQWSGGAKPTLLWLFVLASGVAKGLRRRSALYRRLKRSPGSASSTPVEVDWVSGAAMVMRRQVYEQLGPLDERYRFFCQDLDYCSRARDQGWRVVVAPGFVVRHHLGGSDLGSLGIESSRLAVLYRDLVLWATRSRGRRWGAAARRALLWGSRWRRQQLRWLSRRHTRSATEEQDVLAAIKALSAAVP